MHFSEQDMRRISRAVRYVERIDRSEPVQGDAPTARVPQVEIVNVTSTTLTSGRYPGKVQRFDSGAGTYSDLDDCWVVEVGTGLLQTGKYTTRRVGDANGRPVFLAAGANLQVIADPFGSPSITSNVDGIDMLAPATEDGIFVANTTLIDFYVVSFNAPNHLYLRRNGYDYYGSALVAFAEGASPGDTFGTTLTLPANGGSVAIPLVVPGKIGNAGSLTVRNTDTASARSWEWRLYKKRTSSSGHVPNANGTDSFTPGAASNRTSAASGNFQLLPGLYWLVVRNTHATNTFGLGVKATGTLAPDLCYTKTLGTALGSTLDLTTSWTADTNIPGVYLK